MHLLWSATPEETLQPGSILIGESQRLNVAPMHKLALGSGMRKGK